MSFVAQPVVERRCSASRCRRLSTVRANLCIYDMPRFSSRARNLDIMRGVYSRFPGITVAPLHFPADINGHGLLATMKIDQDQRLGILDSFLDRGNAGNCVSMYFKEGQLTIIE